MSDTMTISVGSVTETWEMSDDDAVKFQAWVQDAYGKSSTPEPTQLSLEEAESLWAQATLQGTIDNVNRFVKLQTASDAVADVPPIERVSKSRV